MRPNKQYFIVGVSLAEQKKKKTLSESIIIADTYDDMRFYLQQGKVLGIGDRAHEFFPEVQEGDTLVFHHTVEDDDWRLLETVEGIERRVVAATEDDVFAVIKQDGTLIPARAHIWCKEVKAKQDVEKDLWNKVGSLFLPVEGATFDSGEAAIRARIEELDNHVKFMAEGVNLTADIVNPIKREQAELTYSLNKKVVHRLEVINIHPESARRLEGIEPGDHVYLEGYIDYKGYPLAFNGQDYLIARFDFVVMGLKKWFIDNA